MVMQMDLWASSHIDFDNSSFDMMSKIIAATNSSGSRSHFHP